MNAVVVYESLWGNTAAIARAIAEGLGGEAAALSTGEATPERVAQADLVVAGAPILGFTLPTEGMRDSLTGPQYAANPPDLSAPSMRAWLESVPPGSAKCAGFETRIWWSPGSSAGKILESLRSAGYQPIAQAKNGRFLVTDRFGPLKEGEVERARAWGRHLAQLAE